MKAEDLKKQTEGELKEQLESLKKELYKIRVTSQTGRIEKVGEFQRIKKDVARILTILKEKQNDQTANVQ